MKKAFITMCAVLIASVSMAAGHVDSVRYLTTKAGQNWFISANGTVNWWQGSDRFPGGGFNTVHWDRMAFGGNVALGKWINHKVGVRMSYDINGLNSYINGRHINLTSIQFLYGNNPQAINVEHNGKHYQYFETHAMYHNLHADFLFSPVDFFQGYYNPNRVWTPVLAAGMGLAAVSEHIFVTQSIVNKESCDFEFSFQAGLLNRFRMNDYLDLNVDFNWSIQRWNIDSGTGYEYGVLTNESPKPRRADYNYSAGIGLTYYIGGRHYDLPNNYENEMNEMIERIKNLERELEAAEEAANNATSAVGQAVTTPADTVVIYKDNVEAISYPFSIFFNKNSYELMSSRDLVNLREIANVAKANGYKLRLRGSCDSATATPAYNQKLSENRCRKIMMELLDMGFPEKDIILEPVGGVAELKPAELDRRVLIDLIKYHE